MNMTGLRLLLNSLFSEKVAGSKSITLEIFGAKFNYLLSTNTSITSRLSYTVLEDDIKSEKRQSKPVEAGTHKRK